MFYILLQDFIGDLKTQRTRAFLTFFAVTWGTLAVVLLLAFGEGLKRTVRDGLVLAELLANADVPNQIERGEDAIGRLEPGVRLALGGDPPFARIDGERVRAGDLREVE